MKSPNKSSLVYWQLHLYLRFLLNVDSFFHDWVKILPIRAICPQKTDQMFYETDNVSLLASIITVRNVSRTCYTRLHADPSHQSIYIAQAH